MLERFVVMIEEMSESEVDETPASLFLVDLRKALLDAGIGPGVAETICANAEVSLDEYDPENPLWKRFMKAYPKVVGKALAVLRVNFTDPMLFVKKMTLKIDF